MTDKEQMSLFDLTPSEVPLVELPHAEGIADVPPAKKTARSAKKTSPQLPQQYQ
jgi:uracil-DNA glycosylase